jgi:hypothetical protein
VKAEWAWIVSAVLGILCGQGLRIQGALIKLAKNMAVAENSRLRPITYQNSITPTWLTKAWVTLIAAFVGVLIAAGFVGGIWKAVIAGLIVIGGTILSGSASVAFARPRYLTYYRLVFHTLVNREADYRRDGDLMRADAAKHFAWLMTILLGDELTK